MLRPSSQYAGTSRAEAHGGVLAWLNSWWLKTLLLGLFAALVLVDEARVRARWPRWGRQLLVGLALLGSLAGLASFSVHARPWRRNFLNLHDAFHYYFGAKYFDELGYDRLYHCTVLALAEQAPEELRQVRTIRSLRSYLHVDLGEVLRDPEPCRAHFSAARWREFLGDLDGFRLGRRPRWREILADKGYNATPVWTLFGRRAARAIPVQPQYAFRLLGVLDLLLLGLATLAWAHTFGLRRTALLLLFLGGCFELTRTHTRGSLLRLDWLAYSLAGLAAFARGRARLAGGLLGLATLLRLFPGLLLVGPGLVAVTRRLRRGAWAPLHRRAAQGGVLVCGLLLAATVVEGGGLAAWRGFAAKMAVHAADVSTVRVGLRTLLHYRGERGPADYRGADARRGYRPYFVQAKQAIDRSLRPLALALGALTLLALAWGLRGSGTLAAVGWSFPLIFVAQDTSFYYYSFMVVVAAAWIGGGRGRGAQSMLVALALVQVGYHGIHELVKFELLEYFYHSLLQALLVVLALGLLLWQGRRQPAAAAAHSQAGDLPGEKE